MKSCDLFPNYSINIIKRINILRLILNITHTSGVYHQTILPFKRLSNQTVLSIFKPEIINKEVDFYNSNNSIIKYIFLLRKIFTTKNFDIIHAHTPHVGFLFIIYSMIFGFRSTKKFFSIHYSFDYINLRNRIFILPIFLFFDSIIFCSESSKKSFPSWYLNIVRKKSSIIYNGVDIKLINKNYFGNQTNDFTLITVSRLDKNKNLNSVINALYQLNNKKIKLSILGSGPEKNSLIKLSSSLGLESQITFYGQVERKKVYELLSSSDLFISMSKTEGHPVSVLEALGAGKPTILSNISPHREIAKNDNCVKIIDEKYLAQSINYFKSKSKKELLMISKSCRNIIEEYFSINKMTNNYINAYRNLL